MKKSVFLVAVMAMLFSALPAGADFNYQIFDFKFDFEYVILKLPNGEIVEGKCESWTDYEGDAVRVRVNGVTYLTHYANVALISKEK